MDVHRTLAGRYELLEVVGRGGLGTVYRARDLVLERIVAVKVLSAEFAEEAPDGVGRLEREARAAASLVDPGIVAVYDSGIDDATRFIVMEYAAGRSLGAILRQQHQLEPQHALDIAIGVADALGAAHALGIVHRDVKPADVMVADDGSVKVLDFGIARAMDSTATTGSPSVLATATYMAPERVRGQPADERSDIYSLGCVLYAMLAGRAPFDGDTVAAILHQQDNVDPPPLRMVDERVSAALDALVMQMLAKSPDDRPQSIAQLRERLAELRTQPQTEPVGATAAAAAPAQNATPTLRRELVHGPRAVRRRLIAIAALAGVALLGVLITSLAGRGSPHAAHSSTNSSTASKQAVASSAGALTTLLKRDVEAHSAEQPAARQIGNELNGILKSYEMGHLLNLPHELANLTQQVAIIESKGQISAAAVAPLHSALTSFDTAVEKAAPAAQGQNGQPAAPTAAPGRG